MSGRIKICRVAAYLNPWFETDAGAAHPKHWRLFHRLEMAFSTERTGYEKTILSDLQGAWTVLRESVVDTKGFDGWDRVLFHIEEAMSWETVRNLNRMPPLLLIIRNLCSKGKAPREVMESIDEINDILKEVLQEYGK